MAEMASRYVQTTLGADTFKRLKVEAIHQDKALVDLLREIVEDWVNNLDEKGENHARHS